MVKKILLVIIIGVVCSLLYICVPNFLKSSDVTKETLDNSKFFHAKMAFYVDSLEDVYDQSPIIIEATIKNNVGEIEFGPESYFTFTEAKVDDILKGDGLSKNDTINIIQTKYLIEDPVLEEGSRKILFLTKYDAKEYANNDYTYACVGGYQGIYNMNEDDTISGSLTGDDLAFNNKGMNNKAGNNAASDANTMLKDFASGKTKEEFIKEIKSFK